MEEAIKKDSISCLLVNERFNIVGTHWGTVMVIDYNGNIIKQFSVHNAVINDLSIDKAADYLGSCSNDGKVVITSLWTDNIPPLVHSFEGKPMSSLSLDPFYETTREFCCGGQYGQLLLNTKGWLWNNQQVIHSGEGPIHCIAWHNFTKKVKDKSVQQNLVAFATDLGIRIYDRKQKELLFVDKSPNGSKLDMYRCCMHWENDQLLVGWQNFVQLIKVVTSSDSSSIQILYEFKTTFDLSGVYPFQRDTFIILENRKEESGYVPFVHFFDQNQMESKSIIRIPGIGGFNKSFGLKYEPRDSIFYFYSTKCILRADKYDKFDHLQYLLKMKDYEKILTFIQGREGEFEGISELKDIALKYLFKLMDREKIEMVIEKAPTLLLNDADSWKKLIQRFIKEDIINDILPIIPTQNPTLDTSLYTNILIFLFNTSEFNKILKLSSIWEGLYDKQKIFLLIQKRLQNLDEDLQESEKQLIQDILLICTPNTQI
uniref:Vps41 beta-propeller domain-containing protein n=1 Tax=Arcella intermedia TaxID=1963864 RepID=A0A6B2L2F2_9EUKA